MARTPGYLERRLDGGEIATKPFNQATKFGHGARQHLLHPVIEHLFVLLHDQPPEGLCESVRLR